MKEPNELNKKKIISVIDLQKDPFEEKEVTLLEDISSQMEYKKCLPSILELETSYNRNYL